MRVLKSRDWGGGGNRDHILLGTIFLGMSFGLILTILCRNKSYKDNMIFLAFSSLESKGREGLHTGEFHSFGSLLGESEGGIWDAYDNEIH